MLDRLAGNSMFEQVRHGCCAGTAGFGQQKDEFFTAIARHHVTGTANEATALGAALFFWARLAMAAVHIAGIPWLRTVTFLVAWAGALIIFWNVVV